MKGNGQNTTSRQLLKATAQCTISISSFKVQMKKTRGVMCKIYFVNVNVEYLIRWLFSKITDIIELRES